MKRGRALVGAVALSVVLAAVGLPSLAGASSDDDAADVDVELAVADAADPTQQVAGGAIPNGSPVAHLWAPSYMAWLDSPTLGDALDVAKRLDFLVDAGDLGQFRTEMRGVNLAVRIFVYENGAYSLSDPGDAYSTQMYAADAAGRQIWSSAGSLLMDPTRDQWIAATRDRCLRKVAWGDGFDGCYLDSMGAAVFNAGWVTGVPVDPRTGAEFTVASWLGATSRVARLVRKQIASPVVINGIMSGQEYANTKVLARGMFASVTEGFVRGPSAPADKFRPEAAWKADVDMIVDAEANARTLALITKVWVPITPAQSDALREYAYASYLLGANGRTRFNFTDGQTWEGITRDHPLYHLPLGLPTGPYTKTQGLYQRSFVRGRVLVNPGTSSVTIDLGATYRRWDGSTVANMTLAPNSAVVLSAG